MEAITSPPRSLAYYKKPKTTGALNESISITRLNVSHRGSFPEQIRKKEIIQDSSAYSLMNSKPGSKASLSLHKKRVQDEEQSERAKKEKKGALARIRSTFHKKKKESNASSPLPNKPIVIPKASTPTKEELNKKNTQYQSVEGCATHEGSIDGDNLPDRHGAEPNPLHLIDSAEFVPGTLNFGAG